MTTQLSARDRLRRLLRGLIAEASTDQLAREVGTTDRGDAIAVIYGWIDSDLAAIEAAAVTRFLADVGMPDGPLTRILSALGVGNVDAGVERVRDLQAHANRLALYLSEAVEGEPFWPGGTRDALEGHAEIVGSEDRLTTRAIARALPRLAARPASEVE